MKTLPHIQIGSILVSIATSILLLSFSSCSNKIPFQISKVVPAAKGAVKVKQGKNDNYVIQIDLTDLAEPDRLQPPRSMYVVWMITENNTTKNIGQIKTSSNFLSSKLRSSFETISPLKPTKIFITAEDNATISYPMSEVILSTDIF
jgi:hypothetical protein